MKAALFMVVAALALGAALARCPGGCSGHGNCGRYDKCTCWANWQGNDCSQRTCAYDHSWAMDNADPHYYAECSSKGICDRETGMCDCFDCYEGRACTRSSCPNGCSGHGKCRYVDAMTNAASYAGWDVEKIQICACDGGFYGADCSQRYCPMGDDPMTVCDSENLEIQELIIAFADTDLNAIAGEEASLAHDELVLSFTDPHGEVWYTQAVDSMWDTDMLISAANIRSALEALPNKVIPSVSVSGTSSSVGDGASTTTATVTGTDTGTADDHSRTWRITWDNPRNIGDQNTLACHVAGCQQAGCQPYYKQMRSQVKTNGVGTVGDVTITDDSIFATRTEATSEASDWIVYVEVVDNTTTVTDYFDSTPVAHEYMAFVREGDDTREAADTTASATSATYHFDVSGIIPVEFSHVYVNQGVYVAFATRVVAAGWWQWEISTPTCTVTTAQSAGDNRENAECSNRGECDGGTGMCACHEGYYGDNCQTQTILV